MNADRIVSVLPNFISLARLFAVPLIVWLIALSAYAPAFWIFIAAGISDAVDGYIAKRFRVQSTFGSYLDPLADKALLVCCYVALAIEGQISTWLAILVVFRDVLIIGGALLAPRIGRPAIIKPLPISKLNTALQIVLVAAVLAETGIGIGLSDTNQILHFAVGGTTLASGIMYALRYVNVADRSLDESDCSGAKRVDK